MKKRIARKNGEEAKRNGGAALRERSIFCFSWHAVPFCLKTFLVPAVSFVLLFLPAAIYFSDFFSFCRAIPRAPIIVHDCSHKGGVWITGVFVVQSMDALGSTESYQSRNRNDLPGISPVLPHTVLYSKLQLLYAKRRRAGETTVAREEESADSVDLTFCHSSEHRSTVLRCRSEGH